VGDFELFFGEAAEQKQWRGRLTKLRAEHKADTILFSVVLLIGGFVSGVFVQTYLEGNDACP
jgi:hypothetical protein